MPRRRPHPAVTCTAAPNIALIKYWGMRDVEHGLPFNSSLSVTLDEMRTVTTVQFSDAAPADRLVLNGRAARGGPLASATNFLKVVRKMASSSAYAQVRSRNNFPTASGLASSASGFAALAGAASRAAGLRLSAPELSRLARAGSGSACRSIFGGFVEWRAGRRPDGRDCHAVPLFPARHWPRLVDMVLGVRDAPEKPVRSAVAMQGSVATSPVYAARQEALPGRIAAMRRAIARRDAARLFPLMIEECDEFRLVCETTAPPLDYLTPTSREILDRVLRLNAENGRAVAGYTHDAGAHVHVFVERDDLPALRAALRSCPGISRRWELRPGPGLKFVPRSSG